MTPFPAPPPIFLAAAMKNFGALQPSRLSAPFRRFGQLQKREQLCPTPLSRRRLRTSPFFPPQRHSQMSTMPPNSLVVFSSLLVRQHPLGAFSLFKGASLTEYFVLPAFYCSVGQHPFLLYDPSDRVRRDVLCGCFFKAPSHGRIHRTCRFDPIPFAPPFFPFFFSF